MLPIYIRQKKWIPPFQICLGIAALVLAIYSFSIWKILLGCFWIFMAIVNYKLPALEIIEDKMVTRTALGTILYNGTCHHPELEILDDEIKIGSKKIYIHSFVYNDKEFAQVKAFLATQNPENNLKRHLIE